MGKEAIVTYLYMHKDSVMTKIEICKGGKVFFENYTKDPLKCAFGRKESPVGLSDFFNLLEDRCFPESRFDRNRVLKSLNLEKYDHMNIIKKTYGVMIGDSFWIKNAEDTITYTMVLFNLKLLDSNIRQKGVVSFKDSSRYKKEKKSQGWG